jgi:hypothetical protein
MSFFKKIFSKEDQTQRKLTHVNQLLVGDIIVLTDSFALPQALQGQQFQVTAINSYEYEQNTQTEWCLQGNDDLAIFLSLEIDDSTELKFSLKIEHDDVETLFDLDSFSQIFDEPGQAFLNRQKDNEVTATWSSEQYQQSIFAKVGYFHRKDHRSEELSAYEGEGSGEQLELYTLYNQDQSKGLDVEVWQDGDTDIFFNFIQTINRYY